MVTNTGSLSGPEMGPDLGQPSDVGIGAMKVGAGTGRTGTETQLSMLSQFSLCHGALRRCSSRASAIPQRRQTPTGQKLSEKLRRGQTQRDAPQRSPNERFRGRFPI